MLDRASYVPPPKAQVDPDHELLMAVERAVHNDGPAALDPAALLAEEMVQDLKLQSLLDAEVPNEGQVGAQVDQVLSARGKLEREFIMMNLDLRRVLSLDQWRQLKAVRGQAGAVGDRVFFRKVLPPGGGPSTAPLPPDAIPLPPLPPPAGDEMY